MRALFTRNRVMLAAALVVTGVLFVDWCAFVFACGCRSLWNGIATYCNIHAETGPHCPWCEHPILGGGVAFGGAALAQWTWIYRSSASAMWKFGLAVASFPVVSGVTALLQRLIWSY